MTATTPRVTHTRTPIDSTDWLSAAILQAQQHAYKAVSVGTEDWKSQVAGQH